MEFKKLESVKKGNLNYYGKESIIKNIDKLLDLDDVRLWALSFEDCDNVTENVLQMYERAIHDFNKYNVDLCDRDLALIRYMSSLSEEELKHFDYYTNDRNYGYLMSYEQIIQDMFENNRPPADLVSYCLNYLFDDSENKIDIEDKLNSGE